MIRPLQRCTLTFLALFLCVATSYAQTVNFTGAPSTLGGGFNYPKGVAVDGSGNVYVADTFNKAVKEIPAGCASASCVTMLGGGFYQPNGVAVDSSGNVYVADGVVYEIPVGCTSASCVTMLGGSFYTPNGVAVDDSGNVYVADSNAQGGNSHVYEIPAGCTPANYQSGSCKVTTLGGSFYEAYGVAVDGSGNVYVADAGTYGSSNVYEMPAGCASANCVTTLVGGFTNPYGVAVDGSGNVYVTVYSDGTVYEIPEKCTSASCMKTLGSFSHSYGVAVDGSGNVYVTDYTDSVVKEINRATAPSLAFPSTNVSATSSAQTVTISNNGNAPLNFSKITYPANFPESASATSDCKVGTAVAAGASCNLTVTFAPTTAGALTGSLVLVDNALNITSAQQTIALSGIGVGTTAAPATLTTPTPGSTLIGPSATFTWSKGVGVTAYKLTIGATAGASNIYNSYSTTAMTETVKNLPLTGATIYATLYSQIGGVWKSNAYTYTAASIAALTTPAPSSTLSSSTVIFGWSKGSSVTAYKLILGSKAGGSDLYNSTTTTAMTETVKNLPLTGATIYATLYSEIGGVWYSSAYIYTAASAASLTTPTPSSTLSSSTVIFGWSKGGGVTAYKLTLGTTKGASNLYNSYATTATTKTATNLPTTGATIYATLYSEIGGTWYSNAYSYTAK